MFLLRCPARGPVGDPPGRFDALVLGASTRQSLATIRSLGRAGLRVVAAESYAECDPRLPVLGFQSRYCAASLVLPSFSTDPAGYAEAIVDFVRQHPTRVLIAPSDGAIAALLPRRDELEKLDCRVALPPAEALAVANDKDRTLAVAESLGIRGPRTVRVDEPDQLHRLLDELDPPFVLKPTSSWAGQASLRLQAVDVTDRAEARRVATDFLDRGVGALGQVWVGGRREGVTVLMVEGEVKAAFAHVEWRTTPALGGASVVRESIPLPEDIRAGSVRLLQTLGLDGLAEVEFRRDASGEPLLMEINARMCGTVEIAGRCGVDFPRMLYDWAVGDPVQPVWSYRAGRRMRWLRGDLRWLRDNGRRAGRPDSVSWLRGIGMFLAEFLRTPHHDCFDVHDLRPVLAEARTTVASIRQSLGRPRPLPTTEEALCPKTTS